MKLLALFTALVFGCQPALALPNRIVDGDMFPGIFYQKNYVKNPDFEKNILNITQSASITTRTTTAPVEGVASLSIDATASGQTVSFDSYVFENGVGRNGSCEARFRYEGDGSLYKAYVTIGGTKSTGDTQLVDTGASTYAQLVSINFLCGEPASTAAVVIESTSASAAAIKVDAVYVGMATNINAIQQPYVAGTLTYARAASCTWTRNNTSYGAFGADTDCTTPTTTGALAAPATKIPGFDFNNMPAGDYVITAQGHFACGASGAGGQCGWRLSDGTNQSTPVAVDDASSYGSNIPMMQWVVSYGQTATRSFQIFGANSNNAQNIEIRAADVTTLPGLTFTVVRYPSAADLAITLSTTAVSWSGYHDNTCSFARTNTAYGDPTADTTCAFTERTNNNFGAVTSYLSGSDKLPGFVFTPARVGKMWICAAPKFAGATVNQALDLKLWDGTTTISESQATSYVSNNIVEHQVCGFYNVTSVTAKTISLQTKAASGAITIAAGSTNASAVEWTAMYIDHQFPAPLIISARNEVVSDTYSAFGSTDTRIMRFTNSSTQGSALSRASSAANGDTITVNAAGVYTITATGASDATNTTWGFGISVNSTQLTTDLQTITLAHRKALYGNDSKPGAENQWGTVTWTGYLSVGDVIRYHSANGARVPATAALATMSVIKL